MITTHTTQPPTRPLVLVTGATGKTGRRVLERLARHGVAVRSGSRSANPPFDWDRPETWPAVLDRVTSVYVAYSPDLAFPGAVDAVRAFTSVAMRQGVQQFVLLAGRGEPEAEAAEAVVRESGARWTIVRASWFAQNFSEGHLYEPVLRGEIALPAGEVAEPFVDVDDIADVAVAALLDPDGDGRHDGRTYDVTGPRLMTFVEVAAEIAAATGRPVEYHAVSPESYLAAAIEAGVPAPFAEALTGLFVEVLDGRNTYVGHGVVEALGRPARDFSDYARAVAATGAWDAAHLEALA
jgi:uncharacterized protein YbjT (DUF2867 family)